MKGKFTVIKGIMIILLLFIVIGVVAPFIRPIEVRDTVRSYKYTIYGTHITLKEYLGEEQVVEVPSHIWFRPVREIQYKAFEDLYFVESITLPDTIENVNMTFQGCVSLKYVNLGENVKEIQSYAFKGLSSLKEIVIPEKVEQLSGNTFANCVALESVIFCNPDVEIEEGAFTNCNLDILILKSAKGSRVEAYANAHGIRFEEVDTTTALETDRTLTEYGETKECTYKVLEDGTVCLGPVEIMQGIMLPSEIEGKKVTMTLASFKNKGLRRVEIPDTIVNIGDGTFENSGLSEVNGGKGIEIIGRKAFQNCSFEEYPEFPNVKEIGDEAFAECDYLKSVCFNEGLEKIGEGVFKECSRLREVEIPASVTYIGEKVFPNIDEYERFQLIVEEGSYAEAYAIENEIPYEMKQKDSDSESESLEEEQQTGTEPIKEVVTDNYNISISDPAATTELKDLTDERISIQVPAFAYNEESTQNDESTQTTINKELQLTSVGEHLEILKSEDELSDLKEYQVDYAITKADEDVISVQYFGHVYTTIRANYFSRGITINTITGEKLPVEQYVKIDAGLLEDARNDIIKFESLAGYEKEDMLYYLETFISDYEAGYVDSYDCYFLDDSAVNLIVSTQGGNSSYFVVKIPLQEFDFDITELEIETYTYPDKFTLGPNLNMAITELALMYDDFDKSKIDEDIYQTSFIWHFCQNSRASFDYLEKMREKDKTNLSEYEVRYIQYSLTKEKIYFSEIEEPGVDINQASSGFSYGQILSYEAVEDGEEVYLVAEFERGSDGTEITTLHELTVVLVRNPYSCFDGYSIKSLSSKDITPVVPGDNKEHTFYGCDMEVEEDGVFTFENYGGEDDVQYGRHIKVDLSDNPALADFVRENAGAEFDVTYIFDESMTQPVYQVVPVSITLHEE